MTNYVASYINPDMDGIACMIAIAKFLSRDGIKQYEPVRFGNVDFESQYVLGKLDLPAPRAVDSLCDAGDVVLVDTHHRAQLPPGFPFEKVSLIIDHHPNGDEFANAKIINEKVGAAASIIAKMYLDAGLQDEKILRLLGFAILSNTLNFNSSSTSEFDREVFSEINKLYPISEVEMIDMFQSRARIFEQGIRAAIESDLKEFDTKHGRVGISQLSTPISISTLDTGEIISELSNIANDRRLKYLFFNCGDIVQNKGLLIAANQETKELLENIFRVPFANNIREFDRILFRKVDLVPALND
ncbi:MAG: DHH family phosphoesterase [Alphaproteobacteria bacterium]|nr:DHH family phosphoesterase [Alphaproteobacteria bacterium]